MKKYEKLLKESKTKIHGFLVSTAGEYVPKMYTALRDDKPTISPVEAKDRIQRDCGDMWKKRTILEFLPDEAKDPKRQESGRLGQKKRISAAVSAAKYKEKETIVIDTKGRPVDDPIYSDVPPVSYKSKQNNSDHLQEIEICISRQEVFKYTMMLECTRSQDDNIRLRVILDRPTFQVISADIIKTADVSELEQEEIADSTDG